MKKLFTVLISCILLLSLVGCNKTVTQNNTPPENPKVEIESPIVGTWKYYKDVPKMPSFATWTLTFKNDGTYTTEGDIMENSTSSHADTWGAKGTYSVTENSPLLNSLSLNWIYKGTVRTSTLKFEIKEEQSEKQLIFKNNSGETSLATIGEGKTLYYTIFIKQD